MEEIKNEVNIIGKIADISAGYKKDENLFIKLFIETERTNCDVKDRIIAYVKEKELRKDLCLVSELLSDLIGKTINVYGTFRSRNIQEDGKNHSELYVYINRLNYVEEDIKHIDTFSALGYLCKQPIFRITPRGKKICDLLFAIHRNNRKSDYIPCIAWGSLAEDASKFKVGDLKEFVGRIQSREYEKDNNVKVAFEVSISSFINN